MNTSQVSALNSLYTEMADAQKKLPVAKANLLSAEHRLSCINKKLFTFIQTMDITIIETSMNDDSQLNRSLLELEVMDMSGDPQPAALCETSQNGTNVPWNLHLRRQQLTSWMDFSPLKGFFYFSVENNFSCITLDEFIEFHTLCVTLFICQHHRVERG